MAEPAVVVLQYNHNREAHADHRVASQASALLQRFEAALCALLEAQETYRREVETRWVALQEESRRVEAELAQLRISSAAGNRSSGAHLAESTTSVAAPSVSPNNALSHHATNFSVDEWPQMGALPHGPRRGNAGEQRQSRERDGHRQIDANASNEVCRGDESKAFPTRPRPTLSTSEALRANPEPADPGPLRTPSSEAEQAEAPREANEERSGANNGPVSNGTRKEETPPRRFRDILRRMVQSPHFDMLVGLVIVLNVVVMTIEVEYDGEMANPLINVGNRVKEFEIFFQVMEQFFTLVFFLELVARLVAFGPIYFKSAMNCLDACIVVVSCVDSWILSAGVEANAGARHISLLRIIRLLRLMKVLRVVRVMKAFSPLRVLVAAVANSIGALLWSMTLLFVLQVIGAILLAQMLRPTIQDTERDIALREDLWRNYGTMMRALLTVFEITMAPGGFLQHRKLYDTVSPLFCWVICIYVCFVTFAVTRVITAMFLKETLAASDPEPPRPSSPQDEAGT